MLVSDGNWHRLAADASRVTGNLLARALGLSLHKAETHCRPCGVAHTGRSHQRYTTVLLKQSLQYLISIIPWSTRSCGGEFATDSPAGHFEAAKVITSDNIPLSEPIPSVMAGFACIALLGPHIFFAYSSAFAPKGIRFPPVSGHFHRGSALPRCARIAEIRLKQTTHPPPRCPVARLSQNPGAGRRGELAPQGYANMSPVPGPSRGFG